MWSGRWKFLPHSAVISSLWPWCLVVWEWFPMFLWSYHRKNIVGEIESIMGILAEWGSPSWICIPQESVSFAYDFWNTNSLGLTSFRTGTRDWCSMVHTDGLMQERCNSIADALELLLPCTNPSIHSNLILGKKHILLQCWWKFFMVHQTLIQWALYIPFAGRCGNIYRRLMTS